MPQKNTSDETLVYAGIFRRLFAISYDCFLLTAILFIVGYISIALNSGEAVESQNPLHLMFVFTLVSVSYLYFGWFWTHGGQTLGMQTWRIRLRNENKIPISWKQVTQRYVTAILSWGCFGLGFIWLLFTKKRQCWHDIVTKTVMIDLR